MSGQYKGYSELVGSQEEFAQQSHHGRYHKLTPMKKP